MDHYGSSLTASDLRIFLFLFLIIYFLPQHDTTDKVNIEVYTLQLSDSIFLLFNIYKIDVF